MKAKLALAERTYQCEACGLVLDRDVNAARNLLSLAASGAERRNAGRGTRRPRPARHDPPNPEPGPPHGDQTGTAARQQAAAARAPLSTQPQRHQDSPQPAAGAQGERDLRKGRRTLRRELLDRLLIVNEHHLRLVLTEYLQHYNTARPHRSVGQLTPAQAGTGPPEPVNLAEQRISRKQVLGGLTHEYYVAALVPAGHPESGINSMRGRATVTYGRAHPGQGVFGA